MLESHDLCVGVLENFDLRVGSFRAMIDHPVEVLKSHDVCFGVLESHDIFALGCSRAMIFALVSWITINFALGCKSTMIFVL